MKSLYISWSICADHVLLMATVKIAKSNLKKPITQRIFAKSELIGDIRNKINTKIQTKTTNIRED